MTWIGAVHASEGGQSILRWGLDKSLGKYLRARGSRQYATEDVKGLNRTHKPLCRLVYATDVRRDVVNKVRIRNLDPGLARQQNTSLVDRVDEGGP